MDAEDERLDLAEEAGADAGMDVNGDADVDGADADASAADGGGSADVDADAAYAARLQAQLQAEEETAGKGLRRRRQVQYNEVSIDTFGESDRAPRRARAKPQPPSPPAARGGGKPRRARTPSGGGAGARAPRGGRRARDVASGSDDDAEDASDETDEDYVAGGSRRRARSAPSSRARGRPPLSAAETRRSGRDRGGGSVRYTDDGAEGDIYFSDEASEDEDEYAAAAAAAKVPASLSERKFTNLGLDGAPPQVEKLLAVRRAPAAGGSAGLVAEGAELEYLVKFKGRSYLHTGWVAESELLAERGGAGRISRFEAKRASSTVAGDDDEPFDPQFVEVERIVAADRGPYGPGRSAARILLVKWRSLPYSSCTWELESAVRDDDALARFEQRSTPPAAKLLRKHVRGRHQLRPWAELSASPAYRAGHSLRPYQLEGLNWLSFSWHEGRNVILADEMGLGKTVQSVSLLNYLYTEQQCRGPFLVVAPLSTVPHWTREIEGWTDLNCVLYHGDKESRAALQEFEWRYERRHRVDELYKFNVIVTTFEMVLEKEGVLKNVHWNALIVDEAHRLKNATSRLALTLDEYSIDHTVLLTGTPLQNSKEELFALLHFVAPREFPSQDDFDARFGALDTSAAVDRLNEAIKPFLLRRMKADVEKSVPPKEETIVEVELTALQKQYYRAIYERNTEFLNRGARGDNAVNLMNIMMELRKCCNHPFLVNGVEDAVLASSDIGPGDEGGMFKLLVEAAGKLVLLDKLLPKLKAGGHKVLVFSQMVRCLDILEDYLKFRKYAFERLDGNVRGNDRQSAIDRFSRPGSEIFVFLLCTRAGGLGINLTAADTVVIYDSDWNPQNDIQAQARCHRIGQTHAVKVYRLITRNTYEMEMFRRASIKLGLDHAVLGGIDRGNAAEAAAAAAAGGGRPDKLTNKEIDTLLKHGAYHIFNDEGEDDASARFNEADIDEILERSSRVKTYDSLAEAGSTFAKATFVSSGGAGAREINVDDDDFWAKIGLTFEPKQLESLGDRQRRTVSRFGMDSGAGGAGGRSDDDDDDESYADADAKAGGGAGSRVSGAWSKKARDVFIGGILRFGPTRLRRCELATPTPGHEGTCYGKPVTEQRAVASGFAALCLTKSGSTVADFRVAALAIDREAKTGATDAVLRETKFLERVARNATTYLEKMQAAWELHSFVAKGLGLDAAGAELDRLGAPPPYTREGALAFGGEGGGADAAAAAGAGAEVIPERVLEQYAARLRELSALEVPNAAQLPGRTPTLVAGWGVPEDRCLIVGLWLYGLNGYDLVRRDTTLVGVLSRIALVDAEGEQEGAAAPARPPGAVPWPSRDALDRRFRYLLRGGDGAEASRRQPAAPSAKQQHRPTERPRAQESAAGGRAHGAPRHSQEGTPPPNGGPRLRATPTASAAEASPPPAAMPSLPADVKAALSKTLLKFGRLDTAGEPARLGAALSAELGRAHGLSDAQLGAAAAGMHAEWERLSKCGDPDKMKKAKNKLTRLVLCENVLKASRSRLRSLAVGKADGLPPWWTSPANDEDLIRGSAEHGFGSNRQMFADSSLFRNAPPGFNPDADGAKEAMFKRIKAVLDVYQRKGGTGGAAARPPAPRGAHAPAPPPPSAPASTAASASSALPPKKQFALAAASRPSGPHAAGGASAGPSAGPAASSRPAHSAGAPPAASPLQGSKRPAPDADSAPQPLARGAAMPLLKKQYGRSVGH